MAFYLLENVNVDTVGAARVGLGGRKVIHIGADDFGGGSVTLEGRGQPHMPWTVLTYGGNPAIFTANILVELEFHAQGFEIRATLSGSSGASNVSVFVMG